MTAKLNAIYVTPQAPTPTTTSVILREVMFWSRGFEKIQFLPSFQIALKKFETSVGEFDLILVSSRFKLEAIRDFICKAKAVEQSECSSYLLIMNEGALKDNTMQKAAFATEVDGLVFKPYSVDIIDRINTLTAEVTRQRGVIKRTALEIVCTDSLLVLDPIASERLDKQPAKERLRYFREVGCVTLKLSERNLHIYSGIASDDLANASPPKCLITIQASSYLDPSEYKLELPIADDVLTQNSLNHFKTKLASVGKPSDFLDVAVNKISQRLGQYKIRCNFVDIAMLSRIEGTVRK